MKKILIISFIFLAVTSFGQKIPFQGRLLDNERPFNGTATIDFSIESASWSESQPNVEVVNGYYAVVLGELTPLPEGLFKDTPEVELTITVNSQALTPITLYSPLRPFTGANPVEIDSLRAKEVSINGINDETKIAIGTFDGGYEGGVIVYDSLNAQGSILRTLGNETTGFTTGYLQLNGRESGALRSIAVMGASFQGRANSYMDLYGGNSTNDGFQLLVDVYGADVDPNGPIPDGYRRGGIDIFNYYGNVTHNIFSEHIGSSTISHINLNASQDTGDPQFNVNMNSGDGVTTGGSLNLNNFDGAPGVFLDGTAGGAVTAGNNTAKLLGDLNLSGAGGLELADNSGNNRIVLDGSNANISANRTDGGSAINMFVAGDNGGIAIQNATDQNKFFYEASTGILELRDDAGVSLVSLEGNSGELTLLSSVNGTRNARMRGRGTGEYGMFEAFNATDEVRAEMGSFGDNSGFMILYGDNGNKNVQIDRDPTNLDLGQISIFGSDGITQQILASAATDGNNEWGFINISGPGAITLDGNSGTVTAVTVTQTSDKRQKKNIKTLENTLSTTLRLRGVSYQWKSHDKPQENQIGLIAQEVEEIYPEFVHTDEQGMKSVNYSQLSAVLIEAIKELNAKVEVLEAEKNELKASLSDVAQLRKEMDQLMKVLGASKAASK